MFQSQEAVLLHVLQAQGFSAVHIHLCQAIAYDLLLMNIYLTAFIL